MPFQLESRPAPGRSSKKIKTEATELISCRLPLSHVRLIDEFLAARTDGVLKTRSDVLRDAVMMWLETKSEQHALDPLSRLYMAYFKQEVLEQNWSEMVDKLVNAFTKLKNSATYLGQEHDVAALLADVTTLSEDCGVQSASQALAELESQIRFYYEHTFKTKSRKS